MLPSMRDLHILTSEHCVYIVSKNIKVGLQIGLRREASQSSKRVPSKTMVKLTADC
jgi:hypothetical protein